MQGKIGISLLSSLIGVIVFFLASATVFSIYGFKLYDMGSASMVLCLFALMVFQISGFVAGIKERSKIGMAFSIVFIIAAAAIPGVFSKLLNIYRLLTLTIVAIPIILMGVLAGLTAMRIQTKPSLKIYKPLLILWLTPSLWCAVITVISAIFSILKGNSNYKSTASMSHGLLLILFGPWATIAGKLVNWPNAGEFFSLPAALILTAILICLIAFMRFGNRIIQSLSITAFASFILVWVLIGIGQMLNCID
jgi:hypothetical protein